MECHRCLLIPEIVSLICGEVGKRSLHPLTVLARTCRLFHEPALEHLWYEVNSLAFLIMCMPQDLWTIKYDYLLSRTCLVWRA
jgi:hypothetical protein